MRKASFSEQQETSYRSAKHIIPHRHCPGAHSPLSTEMPAPHLREIPLRTRQNLPLNGIVQGNSKHPHPPLPLPDAEVRTLPTFVLCRSFSIFCQWQQLLLHCVSLLQIIMYPFSFDMSFTLYSSSATSSVISVHSSVIRGNSRLW